MSNPTTLLELIQVPPAGRTAIVIPESGIKVTYKALVDQVVEMANALASIGIGRGDRVATVLPNGLPAITSFIAASVAGTAAPLNSGYREDEFAFYLEDTSAKVLLVPPDGAEAARKAAETLKIPVYSLEMDDTGYVRIAGAPSVKTAALPTGRRRGAGSAHQRQHRTSQARANPASQHRGFDAEYRGALSARARGCLAVRDAAVPRARTGGLDAFHAPLRRYGGGAG